MFKDCWAFLQDVWAFEEFLGLLNCLMIFGLLQDLVFWGDFSGVSRLLGVFKVFLFFKEV